MNETQEIPFNTEVKDIRGQRFGRLVVQEFVGVTEMHHAQWRCLCDCGKEKISRGTYLIKGATRSCGCLQSERSRERVLTHGKTDTDEFRIWAQIIQRTENPKIHNYDQYGGRGITVCPEWRDSFETFLGDMGERPSPKHSLDRKDNDKGYCKDNCRWATQKEQCRNKRNNHRVEYHGESLTLSEWTERLGFRKMTLRNRIVSGWDLDRAMTEPEKEIAIRRKRRMALFT